MTPRISASRVIVKKLEVKINDAKRDGDVRILSRGQALMGVLSGATYEEIGIIVNVSTESIRLWVNSFVVPGVNSLVLKRSPGRPPNLTKKQKKIVKAVVKKGPETAG